MRICSTLFLLFTLLYSSCNYIPCSASSDLTPVKNIPVTTELAGIYKPDSFTKEDIPGYYYSDSTYLELTKTGMLYLNSFAKSSFGGDYDTKDTSIKINGNGAWKCSYQKTITSIASELHLSDSSIIQGTTFKLYKKNDKFVLLLPVGDPDNCTALRLFQQ